MSEVDQTADVHSKASDVPTPSALLGRHRKQVHDILRRFRMENPRIFGSVARGEDTTQSDLDILVDAPPSASLYDLAAAENELELLLGIKVDVVTKGLLAPDIVERIDAETVPIP